MRQFPAARIAGAVVRPDVRMPSWCDVAAGIGIPCAVPGGTRMGDQRTKKSPRTVARGGVVRVARQTLIFSAMLRADSTFASAWARTSGLSASFLSKYSR